MDVLVSPNEDEMRSAIRARLLSLDSQRYRALLAAVNMAGATMQYCSLGAVGVAKSPDLYFATAHGIALMYGCGEHYAGEWIQGVQFFVAPQDEAERVKRIALAAYREIKPIIELPNVRGCDWPDHIHALVWGQWFITAGQAMAHFVNEPNWRQVVDAELSARGCH
jgi:hypothetical protein